MTILTGERSNKYFLALLKQKDANGRLQKLVIDNTEVTEPPDIEKYVTDFYRSLYNQKRKEMFKSDEN